MAAPPIDIVLIIDDDDAKRHTIAKILRKAAFEIREARTGTEGLRLAAELPALVILDVKLPDLTGFEVCRRLKEDPATSLIPVLHISTTFVDMEDRVHGLEGGADGYLTDALEPVELIATVKALLRARRAEEAAHSSTSHWQVTFDAISDGVLLLDRGGHVIQVNAAMEGILGASWNDLSGRMIHELLSIPAGAASSPFDRMRETGRRESAELSIGDRWLRVTVDPLRDTAGSLGGGICIASDISDRRRLEETLRSRAEELAIADRRKDEFLAMLAHELRNPLAPISNALESIRLDQSDAASTEEALDIARRQVDHMARLLDDLLDVSRFTRGNVRLKMVPLDLTAVLKQAVETSLPLILAGDHTLSTSFPDEPIHVRGDPTRLGQVVSNLLNNAAKYTDRGGQIALIAEPEGEAVVVRVRDNGIGLSAEMLPRVFDLFAQEDRSLDRSQGGLGIGLTLVRSLVDLHEGTVSAASPGVGSGSEFTIRLPVPPPSPSQGPRAQLAVAPPPSTHPQRILVVDDNRDSARSLARVLRLWKHTVRVAHDGPEALRAASEEAFDLILLDIGLPGMDGYQVAAEIRKRYGEATPTLIALTGYGQEADLARSQNVGFNEHMIKPVDLDHLKARILALGNRAGSQGAKPRPNETPL